MYLYRMRLFPLLLIFLTVFTACNEKPAEEIPYGTRKAIAYNNVMITFYETVREERGYLAAALGEKSAPESQKLLENMNQALSRLADSLLKKGDFEGDSSLRYAMQVLINSYRRDLQHAGAALSLMYSDISIDTLLYPDTIYPEADSLDPFAGLPQAYERIFGRNKTTLKAEENFHSAQKQFARKSGFLLVNRKARRLQN